MSSRPSRGPPLPPPSPPSPPSASKRSTAFTLSVDESLFLTAEWPWEPSSSTHLLPVLALHPLATLSQLPLPEFHELRARAETHTYKLAALVIAPTAAIGGEVGHASDSAEVRGGVKGRGGVMEERDSTGRWGSSHGWPIVRLGACATSPIDVSGCEQSAGGGAENGAGSPTESSESKSIRARNLRPFEGDGTWAMGARMSSAESTLALNSVADELLVALFLNVRGSGR